MLNSLLCTIQTTQLDIPEVSKLQHCYLNGRFPHSSSICMFLYWDHLSIYPVHLLKLRLKVCGSIYYSGWIVGRMRDLLLCQMRKMVIMSINNHITEHIYPSYYTLEKWKASRHEVITVMTLSIELSIIQPCAVNTSPPQGMSAWGAAAASQGSRLHQTPFLAIKQLLLPMRRHPVRTGVGYDASDMYCVCVYVGGGGGGLNFSWLLISLTVVGMLMRAVRGGG